MQDADQTPFVSGLKRTWRTLSVVTFSIATTTLLPFFATASIESTELQIRKYCIVAECDTPLFYRYYAQERQRFCEKERPVLLRDNNQVLLFNIAKRANEFGLRSSVAVLPVMESSLNSQASAHKPIHVAKGLWQFKPGTARDMGLRVDHVVDERLDPQKSSDAGLKYLQWLNTQFENDHNMAVLAYYIGIGRLQKMIQDHGTRNPWFLSQLISGFEPGKDYLMKYHGYTLSLMGKGC